MDAWKLLVGSDIGLMSLATIVLVIVIGFGMVMFYKSRADVGKALKEMIKAGEVVDAREWKFSGITRIYIYIRSEQDREWLEQFTPPGGLFRNVREKRLGPEPPQAE